MERDLWDIYIAAETRVFAAKLRYHDAWRDHVMTGVSDDKTNLVWQQKSDELNEADRRREQAYKAWIQVAYSLYDVPMGEDEASS